MGADGLFDLAGQVALVTGAARGLGLAIARTLAAQGARVVLSDIDAAGVTEAAALLSCPGRPAVALGADMGDRASVARLAERALAAFGRIDTLVCNAGIEGPVGPIGEASEADWRRVMDVNLGGALALCADLIPPMAARGGGSVVLMSSIAGLRGNRAIGLYALSKAGLAQLARNLAVEWGPRGVRVNAVSPGLIRTPLAAGLFADEAFMARRLAATPLRRVGEPEEIAGVVALLASRAGGFITGHNLVVDGGTTIGDGG